MTAKRPIIDPIVLAAFKEAPGYFCPKQIAVELNLKVTSVNSAFGRLIHHKEIVFVGTAEDGGIKGVKAATRFYGLPGTARLGVRPVGTNQGLGFDFHPRRSDPFVAHMKLAMTLRGAR